MEQRRIFPRRPRRIAITGDDTPAAGIWGYVRRMTGTAQVGVCLLAVAVALLGFVPVELQRRLIDDAILPGDTALLCKLAAIYAVVLVLAQLLKVALRVAQAWLSESAALYTRQHLARLQAGGDGARAAPPGEAAAVLGPEVNALSGFAGEAVGETAQHVALLAAGAFYMFYTDARLAVLGFAILLPQVLVAPLLQRRLNRMTALRVALMRTLGERAANRKLHRDGRASALPGRIFRAGIGIAGWKALIKASLNLLNALAPLTVLAAGGWLAIQGETTVGVLVAFVSGFQRLSDPMRDLINIYRRAARAHVQHELVARWM